MHIDLYISSLAIACMPIIQTSSLTAADIKHHINCTQRACVISTAICNNSETQQQIKQISSLSDVLAVLQTSLRH